MRLPHGALVAPPIRYELEFDVKFVLDGKLETARGTPGLITRYTDAVTEPVGRIHWADTEAAAEFEGCPEGAVRAAKRAATEVRAALRQEQGP